MPPSPPPLPSKAKPQGESPFMTYGRAAAILLPGFLVIIDAQIVLIPKIEYFMKMAVEESRHSTLFRYFLGATKFTPEYFPFLLGGIILVFTALELGWRSWSRWRSLMTTVVLVMLNALLVLGLLAIANMGMILALKAGERRAEQKMKESP